MNLSKPITRRSFLKRSLFAGTGLLAASGLLAGYGFGIEPSWYEVSPVRLTFDRLPAAFHGKRIVQFSDVHIGEYYDLSHLRVVVDLINEQKPDILVFTGDLFDYKVTEDPEKTAEMLASLHAPLGKWAVLGNHDYYVNVKAIQNILRSGHFSTLINSHSTIQLGGSAIQIAGVDDMTKGKPNVQAALQGANSDLFTLLLSHSANYADIAAKEPIDLQLSGHSHGGQIRLPLLGAVVTPPNGNKYVMGHYVVEGSKLQIYTNRGIGTSYAPVRFLCRPEITVITLEQKTI